MFCGTRYAVGVSNGTDALHMSLVACGISPGDEVITVPNTYIATVFAITYVGALPVFVDVKPDTFNLNPRLLEAAFLRVKMGHMSSWIALRQHIAERYRELLAGSPVVAPYVAPDRTHAYYLYTILAPRRDELCAFLTERGIGTQIIYPTLVPDQPVYQQQPQRTGPIPVARELLGQLLCLPVFPELREDEIERVACAVREFYGIY